MKPTTPAFPTVALGASLVSLLTLVLTVMEGVGGVPAAGLALLAVATLLAATVTGRSGGRGGQAALALLLAAQTAAFLGTIAGSERLASLRLLQVALVAGSGALVVLALLATRGRAAPRPALLATSGVLATLLAAEGALGALPQSAELPLRPEWSGLLDPPSRGDDSLSGPSRPAASPDSVAGPQFLTGETAEQWLARTGTQASEGPAWSGHAEAHPDLGVAFLPGSELRTWYFENPRGTFESADFRSRIWQLAMMPGNEARLDFPPQDPELVRIAIAKANPDTVWHIHLDQPQVPLESRAPYALEFRARADRPRSIIAGVSQAHPPWGGLGLYERVELTSEWRSFRQNFVSLRADANARIHFDLAGSAIPVEVSAVVLHGPHDGRPVGPALPTAPYFVRYRFNALGCRGSDSPDSGRDSLPRLLVLGDAFTLGVGVREQDSFARRVQTDATPHGAPPRRSVLNCGVPGYGTHEERLFYEQVGARADAGTVLLVMGLEDDRWYWEQRLRAYRDNPGRLARWSAIWRALHGQSLRRRQFDYAQCLADIRQLDRAARERHARLLVAVLPTDTDPRWGDLARVIREGLSGSGIPAVVLDRPLLPDRHGDEVRVAPGDPHPNELVHLAAARELLAFLKVEEGRP